MRRTAAGVMAAAISVPAAVAAKTCPSPASPAWKTAVVGEVVPVEQQDRDRRDPVEEPVRADRGQRRGDLAPLGHVPGTGDQPAGDVAHGLPARAPHVVRPELVRPEPAGQERRRAVAEDRGQRDQRVPAVAVADDLPQQHRDPEADRGRDRAAGRAQRVAGDQLLRLDDVRLGGRLRGQEEPVDRGDQQRGRVERHALDPGRDLDRDDADQQAAQHVGPEQHPLPPPAVQQHAGERPDERVRQQQHGERAGDLGRVAGALRAEQHHPGQARLEHPIGALAGQPGAVEPAEVRPAQHLAQGVAALPLPEPAATPLRRGVRRGRDRRTHPYNLRPDAVLSQGRAGGTGAAPVRQDRSRCARCDLMPVWRPVSC